MVQFPQKSPTAERSDAIALFHELVGQSSETMDNVTQRTRSVHVAIIGKRKHEPQGALIAHLSAMSTSVKS